MRSSSQLFNVENVNFQSSRNLFQNLLLADWIAKRRVGGAYLDRYFFRCGGLRVEISQKSIRSSPPSDNLLGRLSDDPECLDEHRFRNDLFTTEGGAIMNPLTFLVNWLNGSTPIPNIQPQVAATITVAETAETAEWNGPINPYTYSGYATLVNPGSPNSPLQVSGILVAGSPAPLGSASVTVQLTGVPSMGTTAAGVRISATPVFSGWANPLPPQLLGVFGEGVAQIIGSPDPGPITLQWTLGFSEPGAEDGLPTYTLTIFLDETGVYIKQPKLRNPVQNPVQNPVPNPVRNP